MKSGPLNKINLNYKYKKTIKLNRAKTIKIGKRKNGQKVYNSKQNDRKLIYILDSRHILKKERKYWIFLKNYLMG